MKSVDFIYKLITTGQFCKPMTIYLVKLCTMTLTVLIIYNRRQRDCRELKFGSELYYEECCLQMLQTELNRAGNETLTFHFQCGILLSHISTSDFHK